MKRPPSPERRLAAVWFADIVGFTALSARDEGEAIRLIDSFQSICLDRIADHGGRPIKFVGDGALAEFPSAEAAVGAALSVRDDFATTTGHGGQLRIGVHVGAVVAGADGDLYGDGVNTAARLQRSAEAGQILASEEVWRQIQPLAHFQAEDLGTRSLPGIPDPRRVFAIHAAAADRADPFRAAAPPRGLAGTPGRRRARGILHGVRRRTALLLVAGLLPLAAFIGVAALRPTWLGAGMLATLGLRDAPHSGPRSVVVLPFDNLGGVEDYLSEGIAEDLSGELARRPDLTVVSRSSAARFRGRTVAVEEVGRLLGVASVVRGAVRANRHVVRLNVELVDVRSARTLWAEGFDQNRDSLSWLAPAIAAGVAGALDVESASRSARRHRPVHPEAYRLVLQAGREGVPSGPASAWRALSLYRLALRYDPDYAEAHANLALAYNSLANLSLVPPDSAFQVVLRESRRALQLDGGLAEAHVAYGRAMALAGRWREAERAYLRAIELKPSYPDAHTAYSTLLMILGHGEEGVEEMRRASDLDPLSAARIQVVGLDLYYTRRYEEAREILQEALRLDPDLWVAHGNLGRVQLALGRLEEARASLERALAIAPHPIPLTTLIAYYVATGREEKAAETLRRIRDWEVENGPSPRTAGALAVLGQADSAFAALERGRWDEGSMVALRWDPALDSIRKDPRYQALLDRLRMRED